MSAKKKTSRHDDYECEGLHSRGDQLRAAAPLDSTPLQNEKSEDDEDGDQVDVPVERANQFAAVLGNDDCHGRGGPAGGEPIAPAHDEAGVFAEGAAGGIVFAPPARGRRAGFGPGPSAGRRREAPNDPPPEEKRNVWEPTERAS